MFDPRGETVAGAQVELRYHVGGPPWNWGSIGVRSDAEGRFESSVLPPGSTTVIARGTGWASSAPGVFELDTGQVVEGLELILRVGGRLTGEVLEPGGRPDAGCTIRIQSTQASERFGHLVIADSEGFFELENLDPGTYHLAAIPDEPAPGRELRAPPVERVRLATVGVVARETVHVVMGARPPTSVRLHGTVHFAGHGPRWLMVAVLSADAPGLSSLQASNVGTDGGYTLDLDGWGDHLVVVGDSRTGEPHAEFLRTIPATGEHRLDLEAPPGGLRGRVIGPDGLGVEGVPLAVHRHGRPSVFDGLGGRRSRSGPDGQFAFNALPQGTYTLRAGVAFEGAWNPTGHAIAVSPRLILEAGQVLSDIELELVRPGTLSGTVLDFAGNPVVGATVFLRDGAGRLLDPFSPHRSGAEGRFSIDHVAPGQVTACARTADACTPESAPMTLHAGKTTEVALVLSAGSILRVRVADTAGFVRADLRILDEQNRDVGEMGDLERSKTRVAAEILSKERTFGPLPPGVYRVIASGSNGESVEQRVHLDGSPGHSLVLRPAFRFTPN